MGETSADVAVLGASGFAGALAARLIDRHPFFQLEAVTSRSDAGRRLDELYPQHRVDLVLDAYDVDELGAVDAAIVAYPHGAAAPVVAELHERGVKVVDLSADFRLRDVATYEAHYVEHPNPELIGEAAYGLPERYRDAIANASIVACPGCFPTAAILALGPLSAERVVIDAKTGVSGAGRAATETTHFVSVDENVKAYGVGTHRHTPEMEQELGVPVTFVQRCSGHGRRENRDSLENEREGSEFLARIYGVDAKTALESYRVSMPAFTRTGIPTDAEIKEHLANDAQAPKLPGTSPSIKGLRLWLANRGPPRVRYQVIYPKGVQSMAKQFRADNIGSLLRPPELLEARAALATGKIDERAGA